MRVVAYSILISILCLLFLLPIQTLATERPLYLVFLMDASGSMKRSDAEEIRKLAAQAIVTLLSSDDRVAVAEFDSNGSILSDWRAASDTKPLFDAINRVGKSGEFTDFEAGLEVARKLLHRAPREAHKVILLLSDGILEPNPYSDHYAPYYIQYRLATTGKNRAEKLQIYEREYREKLSLAAQRLINLDILPSLKKNGVEIYTVGLSPEADKAFLGQLADKTARIGTEPHYFHAEKAVDLMDTFIGLLHYWQSTMKLYTEEGRAYPGYRKQAFIDEFLEDAFFLVLTEKECDFTVQTEAGVEEMHLEGMHPKLNIVPISRDALPGEWTYGFKSGSGTYRLIILGRSTIVMSVHGLKERYLYGDSVNALVTLSIGQKDARSFLGSGSRVIAEVVSENSTEGPLTLQRTGDGFEFEYSPERSGIFRVSFTLFAKDRNERNILPRPSRKFEIEVMPSFFVEPKHIDFGDLKRGKARSASVKVHSGLTGRRKILATGEVKSGDRYRGRPDKLPSVEDSDFTIGPGQVLEREISISAPGKGGWGDFEGKILFSVESGGSYSIGFHVHIPSWVEKLTKLALVLFGVLLILLIVLLVKWSRLKRPVGVLRPREVPIGVILYDTDLSKVKKGIWKRWLNWKKNRVTIGGGRCDKRLDGLPEDMRVELIFYRFGRDFIWNRSPKDSGHVITLNDPGVGLLIPRGPNESYLLTDGLKIKIGDYTFAYENI